MENLAGVIALGSSISHNSRELVAGYSAEEKVHRGQKVVSRFDGKTGPTSPDGTGGEKCQLLCTRQLLDGSLNIVQSSNNQTPFEHRGPEMHGLGASLCIEEALEFRSVSSSRSHDVGVVLVKSFARLAIITEYSLP